MKLEEIEQAAKTGNWQNMSLRRVLTKIQAWATGVERAIGVDPLAPAQGGVIRVAPPPLCTLAVTGEGGRFKISITLPASLTGPVLHEIKSSETRPFESSKTVVTFPDNPATYHEILVPNATLYFQLRSRYYTSDWNKPQVTQAVYSDLLPSDSLLYGAPDSGGVGYRLFRRVN